MPTYRLYDQPSRSSTTNIYTAVIVERPLTSSCPDGDCSAEDYLTPIKGIDTALAGQACEQTWECRKRTAGEAGCSSCTQGGKVQTQCRARDVSQRAAQVVEAFSLGQDAGNSYGSLESKGKTDARHQCAQKGSLEVGRM